MAVNIKKELGIRSRKADLGNVMYGKIPPQAKELEEAVLGAILLEKDKLSDVLEILPTPDCFYEPAHQRIFEAIKRLPEKGQVVDLLTVTEELRRSDELELVGGAYYLTKLTMNVVTSAHVLAHARIVMEKYIQRELIRICGEMITTAYEDKTDVFDLMDKAETDLFEISNNFLRKNYSSMQEIIVDTLEQIAQAREEKDDVTGVPSGYPSLDAITGGWQKSDLIILAARPAVGKTAFALNLAMNAAMDKHKPRGVAVFSLEMGNTQIVKRMLSCVTQVRLENISRGRLEDFEFAQIQQRMEPLAKAPIFIDDQAGLNIFELRAKCRRLKTKNDIGMVIIDYLQLMQGSDKAGNREQEISKISRELKMMAKELDIPVLALSQLSRAVETRGGGDKGKIPQLSDLRESGAIEQDADMVMFIYRPEYYGIANDETTGQPFDGETHINIAKHRNGRLDTVKLKALLEYQQFVEPPKDNGWNGGNGFNGGGFDDPGGGLKKYGDDMGNSKLIVSQSYQTMQSKANNMDFDDDEFGANPKKSKLKGYRPPEDDDAPF
ncbi:MAG: replicative DNA helicase [Edaphocola sp.]